MTSPATRLSPLPVRPAAVSRLSAFRRLRKVAKFTVVQHYFGIPLAATLLSAATVLTWRAGAAMVLCLLCMAGVVAATTALDDLNGYRDGSDALNYGAAGRGARVKPMLQGGVTEGSVLAFALVSWALALLAGFGALAVAGRWTPVTVGLFLLPALFSPHYSWGLRISYRPAGGELLILFATAATLLWPYTLLVDGGVSAAPVVQAVLLGLWFVIVVISENANDVRGDRAVGRRTLPVLVPVPVVRGIILGLVVAWAGLVVACVAAGIFAPAAAALLAPTLALHGWHIAVESRHGRWLRGAVISFIAFNLGFVALLALNLTG